MPASLLFQPHSVLLGQRFSSIFKGTSKQKNVPKVDSRCFKMVCRVFYVAGGQSKEAYEQSKVAGSQLFLTLRYLSKNQIKKIKLFAAT